MRTKRRQALAAGVMALVVAVPGWAPPAWADDGAVADGAVNHVSVVNTADGSVRAKARASVAVDAGPIVDSENVAVARASCTDCRTVAVAVQVLFVEGPVLEFRPANAAAAVNYGCVRCATFAYARQEVLHVAPGAELDDDGEEATAAIQRQLRAVAASDVPFDVMAAELDRLTADLVAALKAGFAASGGAASGTPERDVDED